MAERVVSPGVFTNEIDASFLPAAISNIGAALIGICSKGPAFVPTIVNSYSDFKVKFGGLNPSYHLPYTAKSYLKSSGTATIVRVLGKSGYTATQAITIKGGSAVVAVSSTGSTYVWDIAEAAAGHTKFLPVEGDYVSVTGSNGSIYKFIAQDNADVPDDNESEKLYYFSQEFSFLAATVSQSNVRNFLDSASAKINTVSSTVGLTTAYVSGSLDYSFMTYTASNAGTAGDASSINFSFTSASATFHGYPTASAGAIDAMSGGSIYAVLFPTGSGTLASSTISGKNAVASASSFTLKWQNVAAGLTPTMSLRSTDDNYIVNILGQGPNPTPGSATVNDAAYVYQIFKHTCDNLTDNQGLAVDDVSTTFGAYNNPGCTTPMILSQTGSSATDYTQLFKFESLSDGDSANKEIKLGIANIKKAGSIAGSDYGAFDVIVREYGDTDKRPNILESFANCNLDPDSSNYIGRKIGDMKSSFDISTSKIKVEGDYAVKSKYIRLANINNKIKGKTLSVNLVPFGFAHYSFPWNVDGSNTVPSLPLRLNQTGSDGLYNSKIYHGLAFDSGSLAASGYAKDLVPWLGPVPSTVTAYASSSNFVLNKDAGVTLDSSIGTKKFLAGFQGGFDGFDPRFFGGPNSDGENYGLGKYQTADSGSYTDALATISNPDEIDINMLVLPGINKSDHSAIYSNARDKIEDRADAFFVFDAVNYSETNISNVTAQISDQDTNFCATYWPWVKINDEENNKHVWVPPSVVVPGVIAYTDKVAHPWFAPAGLNRGGLTEVVMAKDRLTHSERDSLYEERVNPIATFPGEGVVVWGQKTLQAKPSALDRVNVRRLLIALKKFIASSSRFLVFEQNTNATRQRFLNIVNPYMEQVQSNSGLSAFRVVMDETNNTPDVVDRNELRGQIFIQPSRTSEFIVLDFIVQPTGAVFPE